MRLLFALVLMFGVLGSATAARLTDDEFHTEFESAYTQAQFCVGDIKFGSTVPVPDPYIQAHIVKAVDVRCSNVMIHLYNITKTPNQLEDYIGTDEIRKNKFETMKLGTALFVEVIKSKGVDKFPNFRKTWNAITHPKPDGPPAI